MSEFFQIPGLERFGLGFSELIAILINNDRLGLWLFVVETSVDPAWSMEQKLEHVSQHGRLVWCNMPMARMYGAQKPEDILNVSVGDLLPLSNPRNMEYLTKGLTDGRVDNQPSFETTPAGERVFLNSFVVGNDRSGWPNHAFGMQFDVTNQYRALEEAEAARRAAEEANDEKNQLLVEVAHELRNPLHGIRAFLGLNQSLLENLLQLHPTEVVRRNLEDMLRNNKIMRRSSTGMKRYIDDLSDAAMIQMRQFQMDPEEVSVRKVMEDAIETTHLDIEEKQIKVHLMSYGMPRIWADRIRLKQIFCNLLSNAVKFTGEQGAVTIEIRQDNGKVEIRVADNGSGISPDFLPHVFERFRRAKTSAKVKGQGLGLALVKELVELHHGTILAESDGEGRGAMFTVRFPALNR